MEPDLETLRQYTELGIKLAAVNDYGAYAENDPNKRFTNDIEAIKDMIAGKYIFNEKTASPYGLPIKVFRFIPKNADLVCLDIDNKDEKNGMENFKHLVGEYYFDFFHKTTFVETPNNGFHFYFKFKRKRERELKQEACEGVEVKYKQHLTAAGSIKEGKIYQLIGTLQKAQRVSRVVLKIAEQPKKPFLYKPNHAPQNYGGYKPSLDRLRDEAINKNSGHHFRALSFAGKCKKHNYTPEQAKEYICANPSDFGKDEADFSKIIKWVSEK